MKSVKIISAATLFALSATAAFAQGAATRVEQYNDWGAYVFNDPQRGKMCFAVSQPKSTEPSGVNRDPIYFFVTSRPREGVREEVNVITGYPYKEGSKTTIQVGSDNFTLYTSGDGAWLENAAEEARLVNAMRRGSTMVVRGTSRRGTVTTDTYSLSGITAATRRATDECQ
ncbi:invasion associated locus B family protein [uncultured Cohaesibacter sp.]|uniref:invasion associated locus B family protein n=1 Tax=uncultured Cohaesibacter sp. TaxID=1002546 RepID=UPI0029C689C8|nr:invasion associated locus B family protein [uncultured Cohaesibacter sp.]